MTQTRKPEARTNISPMPAKTFKCNNCNRMAFKSAEALQQHRKSVHISAQCQVCKRKFVDKAALNQHKSMHIQCSATSQDKQNQPAISKASPVVKTAVQPASSNQQLSSVIEDANYIVDGMIPFHIQLLRMNPLLINL